MADKEAKVKSLDKLKQQVDDLYGTTYHTNVDNDNVTDKVYDDLDIAIKQATQQDSEYQNISSTSKLFQKLLTGDNNGSTSTISRSFGTGTDDDIAMMFQQPQIVASLTDAYAKTKWLTELDNEFDLICKYMPKLQIALDIKKDAVLCADTYSKEFLEVNVRGSSIDNDRLSVIQNNIKDMIKRYNLSDNAEKWYDNTSKYGEEFVYCIPYDIGLEELLKRKKNSMYSVSESTITAADIDGRLPAAISAAFNEEYGLGINIKLDTSKVIFEAVEHNLFLQKAAGNSRLKGMSESFVINESNDSFQDHLKKSGKEVEVKFDQTIGGNTLEWEDEDKTASNGLFNSDSKDNNKKIKVNGAILKSIRHDRFIPIYIEDTMFGGYYIETENREGDEINNAKGDIRNYTSMTGMFSPNSISSTSKANVDQNGRDNDMFLRTLAATISKKIDKAFINSNADLKDEIYLLLKYNDTYNRIASTNGLNMDIVFIPVDDIHHLKFREDPITHRGISDLWDSLVPAKQWIMLNLTSTIGWTTRGFDRRLYYVKQSLDTNTAQSLLNVVSTIKKGNYGIRQMESTNNILNIIGRFNDYVIPMGPNGEAPIQFDTQPGQQFDFPDQLINKMEEDAVNPIVPLEIVNSSTSMDFAVRYTMTNAKLLRNVLKRQSKMCAFLSDIFTKIYKFEYNEDIELEVKLPAPAFLSMTQSQQLLGAATQLADVYAEVEMANEDDNARALFKKKIIRKMTPSYLSEEDINEIRAELDFAKSQDDSSIYGEE